MFFKTIASAAALKSSNSFWLIGANFGFVFSPGSSIISRRLMRLPFLRWTADFKRSPQNAAAPNGVTRYCSLERYGCGCLPKYECADFFCAVRAIPRNQCAAADFPRCLCIQAFLPLSAVLARNVTRFICYTKRSVRLTGDSCARRSTRVQLHQFAVNYSRCWHCVYFFRLIYGCMGAQPF